MNRPLIVIAGLALLAGAIFTSLKGGESLGNIATDISSTNTSSTVGVVAVKILTSSNGAQYRACTNMGTSTVHVMLKNGTSTGLVALTGRALWASSTGESTIEFSEGLGNLWNGDVWGMTAAGTTTVSCIQI